MTEFAPSEEFVLHCDVKGCQASVSLVSGVPREEHGWGRLQGAGLRADYDVCPLHNPLRTVARD